MCVCVGGGGGGEREREREEAKPGRFFLYRHLSSLHPLATPTPNLNITNHRKLCKLYIFWPQEKNYYIHYELKMLDIFIH